MVYTGWLSSHLWAIPYDVRRDKKNESFMTIVLLIGRDHRKGEFRASIKINAKFTPGRNITRIFRLAHVEYKKYNGDILGNLISLTIMWRSYLQVRKWPVIHWWHWSKSQLKTGKPPNMGCQCLFNAATQIYAAKAATGHEIVNPGTKWWSWNYNLFGWKFCEGENEEGKNWQKRSSNY